MDDARATRALLCAHLRALGFDAHASTDGLSALAWLSNHPPPAVALIDWEMPSLDGLSLTRALRAQPRLATTRVILVTARDTPDDIRAALSAGADEYIIKPFTSAALLDKLRLVHLWPEGTADDAALIHDAADTPPA